MATGNGQSASVIEAALQRTLHDHTRTASPPGVEVITPPLDIVIKLDQEKNNDE